MHYELTDCINYLLTNAQRAVFLCLSKELAPYDITPSQYGVLSCLWSNEGVCLPKQIAETLCLEMSTISGVLDKMQKKGLIERDVNSENRREVFVTITDKGWSLKEPVLKIIDDVNNEIFRNYNRQEVEFIRKTLQDIYDSTSASLNS